MGGHLFIVHGDLTLISCDAWLLPCDFTARPEPSWLTSFGPEALSFEWPAPTKMWESEKQRAMKVPHWKPGLPVPWLVNVGAYSKRDVSWFVAGAREFVRKAAADVRRRKAKPRHGRAKHLLALPVVGTGRGGARGWAGDVVRDLVPELQHLAFDLDIDIALVSNDELMFAAVEAQRGIERSAWLALDDRLWKEGERLANIAANGDLVLFLGAGVGMNAGLPNWNKLLHDLALGAGMTGDELESLKELGPSDQARAIELRMEAATGHTAGPRPLGQKIAESFAVVHGYALLHALLAALPVREVITTNYDVLFERASKSIKKDVSVLPHAPDPDASRWVLKMHGCVTEPDTIVLTREDYMRYDLRRQALAGIVQALLLMRQMLFVGFSLRDDNFHRIADAVRRARISEAKSAKKNRNSPSVHHFGTALVLFSSSRAERSLWSDLAWLPMEESEVPARDDENGESKRAQAARRVEIFFDSVLARTRMSTYLLSSRYEGVLTEPERVLKSKIQVFLEDIERDPSAMQAPAWREVEVLLARLGWSGFR